MGIRRKTSPYKSLELLGVFTALAASGGCGDGGGEVIDPNTALAALITAPDGFYFFPPLAPQPIPTGTFDAAQLSDLALQIQYGDGDGGWTTAATFDRTTTPPLVLQTAHERYMAQLLGADYFTQRGSPYRFRVLFRGEELATADLSDRVFTFLDAYPGFLMSIAFRVELSVTQPPVVPVLTGLSPSTLPVQSTAATISLRGSSFTAGSVVLVDGAAVATTFVSSEELTAELDASLLSAPASRSVRVRSTAPGGTAESGALTLHVANTTSFDGSTTIDDSNAGAYDGQSWVVGGGATVEVNTPVTVPSLELRPGATITHGGCSTTTCRCLVFTVTGDAILPAGAHVGTDARGYLGSHQGGNGWQGLSAGNVPASADYWSGGSHGGFGGVYTGVPAPAFDDPYGPLLPGAGGTSYPGYYGGNGGGCIRIVVGGTLTLDGLISADGGGGGSNYTGGSGGSIWITAGTIVSSSSSTLLRANGGDAVYGAGGGGRITIEGTLQGWEVGPQTVQVLGGLGSSAAYNGGSGTIVHRPAAGPGGHLLVHAPADRYSRFARTRVGTFGQVSSVSATTLTTTERLEVGALEGLQLRPNAAAPDTFTIASNGANTITVTAGDLTQVARAGNRFFVLGHQSSFDAVTLRDSGELDVGWLDVAGSVAVRDNGRLRGYSVGASTFTVEDTAVARVRDLTAATVRISDTALHTTFEPTPTDVFPLNVVAAELTVEGGAAIRADGLGYLGSHQNGNSWQGQTSGSTASPADYWSGGSHGGYGGIYTGISTYIFGDLYWPLTPGAGGTSYPGYYGGNGGGAITLVVSGTFQLDGVVTADGAGGGSNYTGGAGGSIAIDAGVVRTGDGSTVRVRANGGDAVYGAGGGGRIAIRHGGLEGLGINATTIQAFGGYGSSGAYNGGSGTIFHLPDGSSNGHLLLSAPGDRYSRFRQTRIGAFGTITSRTDTTLTTADPLIPGSLAAKSLVPDVDRAISLFIVDNTATTITVAGGLEAASAPGSHFYVEDHETNFDSVTVDEHMMAETGLIVAGGQVDAGEQSLLRNLRLRAPLVTFHDASRLTSRHVDATRLVLSDASVVSSWAADLSNLYPLSITGRDVEVGAGAQITADGLGYLGSHQRGNNWQGRTRGNVVATADYWSGGSHGGFGGIYTGISAASFDDVYGPTDAGAGGTSYPGYYGGSGGGVISLELSGVLTLDGVITANGEGGGSNYTGGAGGSIVIRAPLIETTSSGVLVRANGGDAVYGAGGGGRITLHYDELSGLGVVRERVTAYGGLGSSAAYNGGSGTILDVPSSEPAGTLILTAPADRYSRYLDTRIGAFGRISSAGGGVLTTASPLPPGALAGMSLVTELSGATGVTIVSNTETSITYAGSLPATAGEGTFFYVPGYATDFAAVRVEDAMRFDAGLLSLTVGLEVLESASLDVFEVSTATLHASGASIITAGSVDAGSLVLEGSARLQAFPATLVQVYPLSVFAQSASVGSGARISADAAGYLGSHQGANGWQGRTLGNVPAVADYWSGGSHGGHGGRYSGVSTPTYGDAAEPVTAGAGGTSYPGYLGGSGGGVVRVVVSGELELEGIISANGGGGGSNYTGGAGGSVWVTAQSVRSSGAQALLQASGGDAVYGAGGGGRISLLGDLVGWTVSPATVRAASGLGSSAAYNGVSGSISTGG